MLVYLVNCPHPYPNCIAHLPLELAYIATQLQTIKGIQAKGIDFAVEKRF
ncbi:MAG: hypothetical protein LBE20_06685 [Deltaproteobacteria bacterium]|jgi:hypothetical protein|nr:hypothetical protein [Deltaproteobacteria bacterium]